MTEDATPQNIVILGGSIGGLGTAHYLLRHVMKHFDSHQLILVSPNAQFLWRPACPRAAVSAAFAKDNRLLLDIRDLLKQYPAEKSRFIQGTAISVRTGDRSVQIRLPDNSLDTIPFDALVVATGASTASPLLGLTGNETKLRDAWSIFQQRLPSAKSIVIAGGGPAGIELAGELGEALNSSNGGKDRVIITVVTAAPQILPHLRPSIAEAAERYLAVLGVTVMKGSRVQSVVPGDSGTESNIASTTTITLDNGIVFDADLYVPAIGTTPNTSFMETSFLAKDGRIKVDPSTLRVEGGVERIFAVGDASNYARPTVHGMFDAIPVMCANLKRDLLIAHGRQQEAANQDRKFVEDTRETQFVPIGSHRGVGAFMGWRLPSWLVSLAKGKNYLLWASPGVTSGKQWAKD